MYVVDGPDAARVELRVLHHAVGGGDEVAHAALHGVGRLYECAERVGDHLDRRQRVAVVAATQVQLALQLVQLVLQLQYTTTEMELGHIL